MAKILIVDDDTRVAKYVASRLTAAGHACTIHNSGTDVVEMAERDRFDMLVLDLMLPGVSGFEVCRRVRRNAELYTLPVLIISSMRNREEIMHGLAQGADDFIAKPFDVQEVLKRVEALLRSHAIRSRSDELTGLLGADGIKREIQRKISNQHPFLLAYAELINLRQFAYNKIEARNKAIRHFGRALEQCAVNLAAETTAIGHMGGGHFAMTLPLDVGEAYCDHVRRLWHANLEPLYENVGEVKAYHEATQSEDPGKRNALLDVLFCLAPWDRKDGISAKELFDIVTKIRHNALEKARSGIHKDRRS